MSMVFTTCFTSLKNNQMNQKLARKQQYGVMVKPMVLLGTDKR